MAYFGATERLGSGSNCSSLTIRRISWCKVFICCGGKFKAVNSSVITRVSRFAFCLHSRPLYVVPARGIL